MGSLSLNQTIENTFAVAWGSTTPVAYDNVPFTQPSNASWVKIYVRDSDSEKITMGSGVQRRRTLGTIFVDVFTVVGQGSKPVRTLIDSVKDVFRDLRVNGLQCYEGDVQIFGERYFTNSGTGTPATAQQFQASVAIPFKFDEVL